MATRTYCDHCGNTVNNLRKFGYGPAYEAPPQPPSLYAPGLQAAHQMAVAQQVQCSAPTPPYYETVFLDLCSTCAPIWLKRVKILTEDDPK